MLNKDMTNNYSETFGSIDYHVSTDVAIIGTKH